MACRKCGSDWKTSTGRNCQSCPHCNKLQRHLARKAGRWVELEEQAECKHCAKTFTNVGANVGKAKCCSPACADAYRKAWRAAYAADYKKGRRRGTQASTRLPRPTCKRCGKSFKRKYGGNDTNLYCSKRCFYDARNAGDHAWDRTNQLKATWHKCGPYSSAPSVMAMRQIAKCWKFIFKCQRLLPMMMNLAASQRKCEVCGGSCKEGAARFCSRSCSRKWRGRRECKCGAIVEDAKANGIAYCYPCRLKARQEYRKRYKQQLGSHRKRVRKGGGFWNSKVRRSVVFKRDKCRCYICKVRCRLDDKWNHPQAATVDMVVPASKGGDWDYHNLRCACRQCNSLKSDHLVGQMTLSSRT